MISEFINENGRVNSSKLKESWLIKNKPDLVAELNLKYPSNIRLVEKLWLIINDKPTQQVCDICGSTNVKFKGLLTGYSKFCSTTCSNRSIETVNKKKSSYLKRYGADNPFAADSVKIKIANTCITRYGTANFAKSKEYKDKAISTNIKKYGTDWGLSTGSKVRENINIKNELEFTQLCSANEIILTKWTNKKFGIISAICKKGHHFDLNKWQVYQRLKYSKTEACSICNPFGSFSESGIEKLVCTWLTEAGIKYEQNNRSLIAPFEIDIWIPEYGIGIELNGVHWHSDIFKEPNYHLTKTNAIESIGFRLLHIWEDHLQNRPDLIKSIILSKLGKYQTRIFARKCSIIKVSSAKSAEFMEANHLYGSISANSHIGLVFNNELIAVASFGKLRKSVGHKSADRSWELYRFASKIGTQVIGGASRILAKFIEENNPHQIISFAMRDLSTGILYKQLGFTKVKETSPSYWYIEKNSLIRKHRYGFRKDLLVAAGSNKKLTEFEIMNLLPYHRIWDSGQLLFEYLIKK